MILLQTEAARKRRGKVTSVDKRNVLETSRMWREVVHRVHDEEYPDVELEDLLVDNTAMQLINRPADFDVVVTENMFGDILSDEASMITGSIGMIPSSSLGDGTRGLYEPIHGSAPDIAGQDKANPIGTILASFFIQHITAGGAYVDKTMYCAQISDLISSIIIYLCGFVLFMKHAMNSYAAKREEKAALKARAAEAQARAEAGKGGDQ